MLGRKLFSKPMDVAERYEELLKSGKLGERWEVFLDNETLTPEDKWIVVIARWTTDLVDLNFDTSEMYDKQAETLMERYGEPLNPCTRECFMYCKGAYITYQHCTR